MYTAFYFDEVKDKVRIAHTKIFPYNIHFYIDEAKKQIVIIGIVHNKRGDAIFLDRFGICP
jgi:hypothetical protein